MSPVKIVVVDDEAGMLALLKLELETENFCVYTAQDGKSALELIQKIKPALVLLDVMLPEMDGYEVLTRVKKSPLTKDIPIIMLTAKGLEQDIQQGLDLGADDYIVKPFSPALLVKRMHSVLNEQQMKQKK